MKEMENFHFENGNTMHINLSSVMNTRVKTDASDESVDKTPQNLQRALRRHMSDTSIYRPR